MLALMLVLKTKVLCSSSWGSDVDDVVAVVVVVVVAVVAVVVVVVVAVVAAVVVVVVASIGWKWNCYHESCRCYQLWW